jgi:Ca2+-binding RTX toxin-like protein
MRALARRFRPSSFCLALSLIVPLVAFAPASSAGTTASTEVSSATSADILAKAFDGGGTSAIQDQSSKSGWETFTDTVAIADRNADSGRSARGRAFQTTEIIRSNLSVIGLDSSADVEAKFVDPQPGDSSVPRAAGDSFLEVDFEVTGAPIRYSLTGDINVSATSTNPCTDLLVVFPAGTSHRAAAPASCGEPASKHLEQIGELAPGTHTLTVNLTAPAEAASAGASSGTASGGYDISLRFCTITIDQPGLTTEGTSGDDVICGTSGSDTIFGRGGNDTIFGLDGVDTLEGGSGDDVLDGGSGDDVGIYGDDGNDTIDAGPGNDGGTVDEPADWIAGGPGDDQIDGGSGNDRLVGRCAEVRAPAAICPENPPVPGEFDDDNLVGGLGDDTLFADGGTNLLIGGPGEDFAFADGPEPNTMLLGADRDTAFGGSGSDEIDGGAGIDHLSGEGSADCLIGGTKADGLNGGGGNDKLLAKDGVRDTVRGGAGSDKGRFDGQDNVSSVAVRNYRGGC